MARISLKDRKLKDADAVSGVDSIITSTEQTTPTERETAPKPAASALAKVTLYVRPDQVLGVEAIQLQERQKTGQKKDKSELYQEALDLLIEKYKQ